MTRLRDVAAFLLLAVAVLAVVGVITLALILAWYAP